MLSLIGNMYPTRWLQFSAPVFPAKWASRSKDWTGLRNASNPKLTYVISISTFKFRPPFSRNAWVQLKNVQIIILGWHSQLVSFLQLLFHLDGRRISSINECVKWIECNYVHSTPCCFIDNINLTSTDRNCFF